MDWKNTEMIVYYISNTVSQQQFNKYLKKYKSISQQAQKFNLLLSKGIAKNGVDVVHISTRPINRIREKKIFFKSENEIENEVNFHYVSFFNLPIVRNISVFLGVFFKLLKAPKNSIVICDALNISASEAVLKVIHLKKLKNLAIVTDVPEHRPEKFSTDKKCLKLMKKYDYYVFLTEQMSKVVNPKGKPYIVIEGISDVELASTENRLEKKAVPRVCIYAGQLRRIYGIEYLVQGFVSANIDNAELHIYGKGEYSIELKKVCEKHSNVKFFGTVPNDIVVNKELEATLLINPRPTDEEYTKYSFPSKNMEYMASGTPVLTTNLPGMPREYHKYIYVIDEETEDGMKDKLQKVLALPIEELHNKGKEAKNFVIKNKNNIIQAKRIIDFLKDE